MIDPTVLERTLPRMCDEAFACYIAQIERAECDHLARQAALALLAIRLTETGED